MQDIIASGAAWFEDQRREHLAVEVTYQPLVGLSRTVRATVLVGVWESMDSSGSIVRTSTRDFIVHTDDLAQDPARGDTIVYGTETWEVSVPQGGQQHWRWQDRLHTLRRIHTQAKVGTTATVNASLLVRAIGAHASSSITDDEIKSSLTLDLGTSRTFSKSVVAATQYVYIVLPDSFGTPTFTTNGLLTTAWQPTSRSITFDGQAARAYTIYRSTYPVSGTVIVGVT